MSLSYDNHGWWAEPVDEREETEFLHGNFYPCLQPKGEWGCVASIEIWFPDKASCEQFIAEELVGARWAPGEPTEIASEETA